MRRRYTTILVASLAALAVAACSSDDGDDSGGGTGGTVVGTTPGGTTQTGTTSAGTTPGGTTGGGTSQGGTSQGGSGAADPYEAARVACINKINELRQTQGKAPYTRWTQQEACADSQATQDEQSGSPHGAFGQCGEGAQNECIGGGASNIENCLQSMWNERNQSNCSGCDACADAYNPNCPNCDFYGPPPCGHYVNLSANYYSQAACGFSSLGGWAVIDFR